MVVSEEERETASLISQMPVKNIIFIFIVTFLLVFIVFSVIEPNIYCDDSPDSLLKGCRLHAITGDFILAILFSGLLFLFDMLLLYMTLSEYLMP